jgi:hypothetical protein
MSTLSSRVREAIRFGRSRDWQRLRRLLLGVVFWNDGTKTWSTARQRGAWLWQRRHRTGSGARKQQSAELFVFMSTRQTEYAFAKRANVCLQTGDFVWQPPRGMLEQLAKAFGRWLGIWVGQTGPHVDVGKPAVVLAKDSEEGSDGVGNGRRVLGAACHVVD